MKSVTTHKSLTDLWIEQPLPMFLATCFLIGLPIYGFMTLFGIEHKKEKVDALQKYSPNKYGGPSSD